MNNEVQISGPIAREAKFHQFDKGSVCNSQLKISAGRASAFPDVKGWDEIAEALRDHGAIGNVAFITGALRTELYQDKNDQSKKHKSTYVLIHKLRILDGKSGQTIVELEAKRREDDEEPAAAEEAVA